MGWDRVGGGCGAGLWEGVGRGATLGVCVGDDAGVGCGGICGGEERWRREVGLMGEWGAGFACKMGRRGGGAG